MWVAHLCVAAFLYINISFYTKMLKSGRAIPQVRSCGGQNHFPGTHVNEVRLPSLTWIGTMRS